MDVPNRQLSAGSFALRESGWVKALFGLAAGAVGPVVIGGLLLYALPGLDDAPTALRLCLLATLVSMGLALTLLAYLFVVTAVRGMRRALVVGVDHAGITLGSEGLRDRDRFFPWENVRQLRTYTICWAPGPGDDPPLRYMEYLQVDLRDGTSDRRDVPRSGWWGGFSDALDVVAPHVPVRYDGTLEKDQDRPLRNGT